MDSIQWSKSYILDMLFKGKVYEEASDFFQVNMPKKQ